MRGTRFQHAGCTSAQSRYMFAICCMKLGKYGEAEKALEAEGTPVRMSPIVLAVAKG